jgi:hypothetical protein
MSVLYLTLFAPMGYYTHASKIMRCFDVVVSGMPFHALKSL